MGSALCYARLGKANVGDVSVRTGMQVWSVRRLIIRCKSTPCLSLNLYTRGCVGVVKVVVMRKGYGRVKKQKESIDQVHRPFMLIAFSSLFLIVLVVGSIALLSSIGNTKLPSTLTLAVGGQSKRD